MPLSQSRMCSKRSKKKSFPWQRPAVRPSGDKRTIKAPITATPETEPIKTDRARDRKIPHTAGWNGVALRTQKTPRTPEYYKESCRRSTGTEVRKTSTPPIRSISQSWQKSGTETLLPFLLQNGTHAFTSPPKKRQGSKAFAWPERKIF